MKIADAFVLERAPFSDERGAFCVCWEADELQAAGIRFEPWGAYASRNPAPHTLRGLHYQKEPHAQAKLVSCVSGAVYDVMVDLRRDSPSYRRWEAVELTPENGRTVYVPKGCAHGFLTLRPDSTVSYLIEGRYVPEAAAVARWNDPAFAIAWPTDRPILSERDRNAPDLR